MLLASLILLLSSASASQVNAEDSLIRHPVVSHISVETGPEYMATSVGDELRPKVDPQDRISDHSAWPLHLKYSFSFTNPEIRNYLPGGYQGIGAGLLNIGALDPGGIHKSGKYIGYPVSVYVFQGGPFWHFGEKLSLNYEWNFGAAFGWKPYCDSNSMYNLTVGSRVNAYLGLGVRLEWRLNDYTSVFGGFTVSHYSNGNTSWPNPGVNSFGLRMGVNLTLNPLKEKYPQPVADTIKKRKIEYDLSLWGSSRKRVYKGGDTPVLLPGHFGCAGISFAPMVRLGRWWRVGGSLDIQWDGSSDKRHYYVEGENPEDIRFKKSSFIRQTSWGLSAHGELQMPIFAVNIGLGCNLYAPWENRGLYQNITLKTYLGPRVFLNVGYQLRNFYQQANLMLGLGITI
ncbi:MAG: acyloxyacyl hydrolase [Muribaculaceae bacterium]|nr:acyloxyacyl hydrolase [Muribaculaceae bacterium]